MHGLIGQQWWFSTAMLHVVLDNKNTNKEVKRMDWEMGTKLTAMGVSRISSRKMLMSLTNMSSMT